MLSEFLAWWAARMRELVPLGWLDRGATASALIVETAPGPSPSARLTLRRGGRERDLGRFELDAAGAPRIRAAARAWPPTVVLRLPAALMLDREVTLPLAAEREPGRVLAYEMDRLTPFAASEVFWTYALQRRDRARGRLHLRLSLVPKLPVEPLLAALAGAGITPTMLEAGGRRIDPRPPDAAGPADPARRTTLALAGLCAVLAAAAVALPFLLQSLEAADVEARIAALRPQVDAAEAARRRIAANAAGVDVIAAERQRLGDTLSVLAAVTELLPDDASLTDLTLRQGSLTMTGQAAAAARLIGALAADPVIHNPDFAAPVTRAEGGRGELFTIRAEVGQ